VGLIGTPPEQQPLPARVSARGGCASTRRGCITARRESYPAAMGDLSCTERGREEMPDNSEYRLEVWNDGEDGTWVIRDVDDIIIFAGDEETARDILHTMPDLLAD